MIEVKKENIATAGELLTRKVRVFLDGELTSLAGNWKWEMHTDEIFCSNVFLALQKENISDGVTCLIHPDDVEKIKKLLSSKPEIVDISFRVIMPSGTVKSITGTGKFDWGDVADFSELIQQREIEQYIRRRSQAAESEQNELALHAYNYAEQISAKGIWYVNTVTHQAFYSDNVFRIYGLPPQSLNAHVNTFTQYIHPEEKEIVIDTLEEAYQQQTPTHLQFRIVVDGAEKFISQTTKWMLSDKGQRIVYGVVEDITEKKIYEGELNALKDELQLKNESLLLHQKINRIATWYINLFTRHIVYSDSVYKIYGLKHTGTPLSNSLLLDFVHPDDRQKFTAAFENIFKEHLHPDIEFRITRPDGKARYLKKKGKMIINSQNEMVMLGIVQDVTDEVVAERKLMNAKNNLFLEKTAFTQTEEIAGTGCWIWDLDSGEVNWSEGFYALLGYKSGAVLSSQKVLLQHIHPDDKEKFTSAISGLLNEGVQNAIDFRILRKSEIRYITAKFNLVVNNEQRFFIGLLEDKTEEHLLQQQLNQQMYLAELLTDASPEMIMVVDVNNYIVKWNKKCEDVYDIKKEKAIGRNIFELFPKLKTPEVLSRFTLAQKGENIYVKNERSIVSNTYVNLLLSPIKNETGSVIAVLVMIKDVTTEYRLQEELSERLQFIERLLEASVDRIIVLDRNMNYIYWNKKAEEYYGLMKENVLGKNILELFPAFITDPTYAEFRKALKGEIVHIPASQSLAEKKGYFETYVIPVKGKKNEVSSILWITHDLSKEYLVQRQQQKVSEVMDAINENLFELNDEYRFTYINSKAEEFFGVQKKDVVGKIIWDVLPEKFNSPIHSAIIKAMKEGVATRSEFISSTKKIPIFASVAPTEDGVVIVFFEIQNIRP